MPYHAWKTFSQALWSVLRQWYAPDRNCQCQTQSDAGHTSMDRLESYHIIGHSALPCISWGSFFDQTHACFGIGTFNTRWWNILTHWKILILKCHCTLTHRLCLRFSRCIWYVDLIKCHAYLFCRSVVFTVFLERESGCEFRWRGGQTTSAAAANPADAAADQLAASSTWNWHQSWVLGERKAITTLICPWHVGTVAIYLCLELQT